jgi:ABC-type spermidine/putrescine transport system permease subunit II
VALPCALAIAGGLARLIGEAATEAPRAGPKLRAAGWGLTAMAALPLVGLVRHLSFATGGGTSEALLRGLAARSVALTLACGLAAAGLGFALALARRPRGRVDAVAGLVLLPLAVPPVVYGALMAGSGQSLGLRPGFALTFLALLPELVALAYAGAVLAVAGVQREVVDAARDLGAGPGARALRVWWPLLAPAGVAVTLVGFARALAEASVPAFTSGPGGGTLAVGMAIVARGGEVGVVPRWALALSLAPVAVVWISGRAWRRRAR